MVYTQAITKPMSACPKNSFGELDDRVPLSFSGEARRLVDRKIGFVPITIGINLTTKQYFG